MTPEAVIAAAFAGANLALGLWIAFMLIGILPSKRPPSDVRINDPHMAVYYKRRGTNEWVYLVYSTFSGFHEAFSVPGNERHSEYARSYLRSYNVYISDLSEVSESHAHHIREALDRVKKVM